MKIMSLCAGEGVRFRPHTLHRPKPSIPFLNTPLAFYSLFLLEELGPLDVVVNTYHLPQKIYDTFHSYKKVLNLNSLQFSNETNQLLGSGGGLKFAEKHFSGDSDLLLVNGDEIILPFVSGQLKKAYEQHKKSQALSTLLVMDHPGVGTQFGGVLVDSNGSVTGFTKESGAKHFIGLQFLSSRIFKYLPSGESNILKDGILNGLKQGERAQIFNFDCLWFETGNEKDFLQASSTCLKILLQKDFQVDTQMPSQTQKENVESYLKNIVKRFSQSSQWQDFPGGGLLSATPGLENQVRGYSVLGENLKIEKNVLLTDVVLGNDLLIKENLNQKLRFT